MQPFNTIVGNPGVCLKFAVRKGRKFIVKDDTKQKKEARQFFIATNFQGNFFEKAKRRF